MLGKRLKGLRGKQTQEQVANKLGISRSRYSHYENEHVQPDNELLQRMAELYNVSIDYLLGRTNDKSSISQEGTSDADDKDAADYLLEYIEQGLSDEEIRSRMDFMVDVLALSNDEMEEFMSFVRWQLSKKKQPAASSKVDKP